MQIKKKIKKGFTLVELVVVIAVIAILAAVSIGAYFGITDSANRSADEQAVTQMNTMLETYEILNGKVDDVEEAKDIFEDNGLTDYTPFYGKNTFYWTYDDSRVIIWEEDKGVTYPSWAVEKYRSNTDNLMVSGDWYNLIDDHKNTISLLDENNDGIIEEADFLKTASEVQNNETIKFPENSTLVDLDGEFAFYYWFKKLGDDVKTITVDLNGSTISTNYGSFTFDGKTIIFKNGTIDMPSNGGTVIAVGKNSSIVLRDVNLISSGSMRQAALFLTEGSEAILDGCYISNFQYGIGTNGMQSEYVKYTITNTIIENCFCPVFINVKGMVEAENSVFKGTVTALFARNGYVHLNNCELDVVLGNYDYPFYHKDFAAYDDDSWGSGIAWPSATAVIGDFSDTGSYSGNVTTIFESCEFSSSNPHKEFIVPHMLLAADLDTSVAVSWGSSCKINEDVDHLVVYDGNYLNDKYGTNTGTIQINGTLYNYTDNKYSA